MKRFKSMFVVVLMILALLAVNTVAYASDFDEWLKTSQLGPYAPEVEDWDAVYEAAKQEGTVVVYSSTSRIFDAAQTFEKAYPGITVEAYNISSVEVYEKAEREHMAKIHNSDILMSGSVTERAQEMIDRNMIVNYVPPEVKDLISEQLREPVLAHRVESIMLAYSDIAYDGPPIQSIWELTLPEWEGGLIIRDPLRSSSSMRWLAMFVRHHEEVAADYEKVFGEPIELTMPNAGYELIKRLLDNGMRLGSGSRDVLDAVTAHNLERPAIGAIVASKYRDVLAGDYQFNILWNLDPSDGYAYGSAIAITGYAPHPNAAKLFLNWLIGGGDEAHEGYKPWNVPGNFAVRSDIEPLAPFERLEDYNYWYDDEDSYDLDIEVMDFWLTHM